MACNKSWPSFFGIAITLRLRNYIWYVFSSPRSKFCVTLPGIHTSRIMWWPTFTPFFIQSLHGNGNNNGLDEFLFVYIVLIVLHSWWRMCKPLEARQKFCWINMVTIITSHTKLYVWESEIIINITDLSLSFTWHISNIM